MDTNKIRDAFYRFEQINSQLAFSPMLIFNPTDATMIIEEIKTISKDIEKEIPLFSKKLDSLKNTLFISRYNGLEVNPFVFGQVFEILSILTNYESLDYWKLIHPQISLVSKQLYLD